MFCGRYLTAEAAENAETKSKIKKQNDKSKFKKREKLCGTEQADGFQFYC